MKLKSFLRMILFAASFAISPLPAQAQCAQWDVSGKWELEQGNGLTIEMDLRQSDTALSGRAEVVKTGPIAFGRKSSGPRSGIVGGSINGNDFLVYVGWDTGSTGVYQGSINSAGRIAGSTHEKAKPRNSAPWFSSGMMKCKPVPPPAKPPPAVPTTPKPVKTLGKNKVPQPQPAEAKPLVPPYIAATPPVVKLQPLEQVAKTTLVWDAGPDHPYAEIWLSVDGADETFVMEKGKGSLEVTLQPGLLYIYVLTDSGKRLATVEVRAVR